MDSAQDNSDQTVDESDDLALVREVLLGAEYDDLLELKNSLDDPAVLSQKISSVVSEAMAQRIEFDESLSEVLTPTINSAIQNSITTDPDTFANSLYPVMGPAIRKSISEALSQLLESLNLLLEQSFSPKSLRWRFNAWRTGRSYSEIVLMNTLEYQVEQVFLIHKESSLLIQHVVADLALSKDPDIVSSMLSAIQDYINDSFSVGENELLKSMQLGDLTVLIEQGPYAFLAVVIRGNVPPDLENLFEEKLEEIHRLMGKQLLTFTGGANHFFALEPTMQQCLVSMNKEGEGSKPKRKPWAAVALLLLGMGALAAYFYQRNEVASWRQQAMDQLVAEPGIVVIGSEVQEDTLRIRGLRDPLSTDPLQVARAGLNDELAVEFLLDPFLSIDPNIVERRVSNILQPPDSVSFTVASGTLVISGTASMDWVNQLNNTWSSVHGIEFLDASNLVSIDHLLQELAALKQSVENTELFFATADTELIDTENNMSMIADSIKRLLNLSQDRPYNLTFMVLGDTDNTGTDGLNIRIAQQRAEIVSDLLINQGIPAGVIESAVLRDYSEFSDGLQQRRVVFKVLGLPTL